MIDFTKIAKENLSYRAYGGANGIKKGILIDNEPYMLKIEHRDKKRNEYTNSILSEYIASKIYSMFIPTQEVILGKIRDNNKDKLCVACKDFKQENEYLYEFLNVKNSVLEDNNSNGSNTELKEIMKAIRVATLGVHITPVFCGSAYKNKGVQPLLDAIIDFMPAPTDVADITGVLPGSEEEDKRPSTDDAPFSALAFKIMTDPFVGKLAFFRVYSGVLESGSYVLNSSKGKRERVGRILQMHANKREELETVYSGDIAAAIGLKDTGTGDTLCDEDHPIILESMDFPDPVISVSIEPKTKDGQDKMGMALAKLSEEDPTFTAHTDEDTGQTIISGMGELHLEVIVDRLLKEFKVEANVGQPQVAYKETITKEVEVDSKYAKQSGGRGQYGHVKLRLTPREPGEGYEFVNAVTGGAIPKDYIGSVDQGIQEASQNGILAGYPVLDFKVELYDGSYHDVDSSEMAFKIAGSMGFKDGMAKADPAILEPYMKVEVIVPEEYMGDVIGDINARRGRVESMESRSGAQNINAFVPLSSMFGYATDLRSNTQGRGNYSMFFDHYEIVPKNIAEEIMNK